MKIAGAVFMVLVSLRGLFAQDAGHWHPVSGQMMTRWAAEVSPTNALPEYPRPQMVRKEWRNLNGVWDCAITPDSAKQPGPFTNTILVPFPVESALSGIKMSFKEHDRLWYRRTFAVPKEWKGQRIKLHFGAVDWQCEVSVNGRLVGEHRGGYDAFTFDVTAALQWGGAEEITVSVTDPTEGDQPRGKQSRRPEGIFYTASSGIWQTVWLEPVPATSIGRLKLLPDVDAKSLDVWTEVGALADNVQIEAIARSEGREISRVTGAANSRLSMVLPNPRLWTPEDPFLYDLEIRLLEDGKLVDTVSSYFGMRKISLHKDEQGFTRIVLNNQPIFQVGTLDQGFWPDGLYTAPTDEALKSDIQFLKQAGFNFTRKHVKVEPERWYYWCDKLGLLVWQDMPSGNNATPEGRRNFESELLRMVDGLQNHPAIVVWVLFNEGWGQYDTKALAEMLKARDPSRLVDDASGWTDMRSGDLIDIHNYPGPDAPPAEATRASVLGEFGGFGLNVTNHVWNGRSWGYRMVPDETELASRYDRALEQVWKLHALHGLSAAVYTQTTDVETECNGLLTYDRAVQKMPPEILFAANQHGHFGVPEKVVLADGLLGKVLWKYTLEKPAADWIGTNFDAKAWKEGAGGFGASGTPGIFLNTRWTTDDIWLRTTFTVQPEDISKLKIQAFHDEDAEIYFNGELAARLSSFIKDYDEFDISPVGLSALHAGTNLISVHCHQTSGGQGIDVGLIVPGKSEGVSKP